MVPRTFLTAALLLLALCTADARQPGVRAAVPDARPPRGTSFEVAAAPPPCAFVVRSLDGAGTVDHPPGVQRGRGTGGVQSGPCGRPLRLSLERLDRTLSRQLTVQQRPLPPPSL